MQQFRLAICDDEEYFIEDIKQYLKAYVSETENEIGIEAYTSGVDLLKAVEKMDYEYDIYFLDVDMPQMNGTDVAKVLREHFPMAVICFITSYEQYAYEAFRAEALDYLIKPVKYTDLRHTLNRCVIQIQYCRDSDAAQKRYLEVKTKHGSELLDVKDIIYIEKRRNQCVFHLDDGEMVSYMTLAEVYEELDKELFLYVHQGYIVNFSQIREVKTDVVCLGKNREIPLSRRYRTEIKQRHMDKITRLRLEKMRDYK